MRPSSLMGNAARPPDRPATSADRAPPQERNRSASWGDVTLSTILITATLAQVITYKEINIINDRCQLPFGSHGRSRQGTWRFTSFLRTTVSTGLGGGVKDGSANEPTSATRVDR